MSCPKYQGCGNTLCALNGCCMDAGYWARYWKNKASEPHAVLAKKMLVAVQILPKPPICCYCMKEIIFKSDLTREHLVPVSHGGSNKKINKQPCCQSCNKDRGSKRLIDWIRELEQKHDSLPNGMIKSIYANRIQQCYYWILYIAQEGERLYRSQSLYEKQSLLI